MCENCKEKTDADQLVLALIADNTKNIFTLTMRASRGD